MSIAEDDRLIVVQATLGLTVIDTTFRVDAKDELLVQRLRAGAITDLVVDVDYTVSNLGLETGCRVTLAVAALANDKYALVGDMAAARASSFVDRGGVSARLLDAEMDRFQMQIQEVRRDVNLAPRFNALAEGVAPEFPPLIPGKIIAWGEDGLVNADPTSLVGVSSVPGLVDALAGKEPSIGFTPENAAKRGAANGYAPLGVDAKVPSLYLPSFVDDVLEFAQLVNFPTIGEAGKLYVETEGLRRSFRWGGSGYAEISPSPGSTDAVPEGSVNLYHTAPRVQALLTDYLQGQMALLANIGVGDVIITADAAPKPGRIRLGETARSLSKAAYPELSAHFAAQGYPWGSTSTNFSVPPAAGYFLRFAGTSASIDTGGARTAGSTQADQNKTHSHGVGSLAIAAAGAHSHTFADSVTAPDLLRRVEGSSGGGTYSTFVNGIFSVDVPLAISGTTSSAPAHTHGISGATAVDGAAEARPKNVAYHADMIATPAAANAKAYGVNGVPYVFAAATAAADPGLGKLRLNTASLGAATQLYISETGATSEPLAAWLASWGIDGGGTIELYQVGAVGTFLIATVLGVTDAGAHRVVTLSHVASNGSFADGAMLGVQFWRSGSDGASAFTVGPVPSNTLGNNGDLHILDTDGHLYKKALGVWTDTGYSLRGPVGPSIDAASLASLSVPDLVVTAVATGDLKTSTPTEVVQAGKTGLNKADVGLANVDNTSDADKPISTAVATELGLVATALSGKAPTSHGHEIADVAGLQTAIDGKQSVPTSLPTHSVFSTPGSFTWTKPEGLARIRLRGCAGGGGSGGGSFVASSLAVTAGGGAGGEFDITIAAADLGATEPVVIGAGGAAGAAGANAGGQGGATSFGAHVSAAGGFGSVGNAAAATAGFLVGASGGAVTVGATAVGVKRTGESGNSAERVTAAIALSGVGGGTRFGPGGGPRAAQGAGLAPSAGSYGAGAGGCIATTAVQAGGAGAPGYLLIEEFY